MRYFDRDAMARPRIFGSERFERARQEIAGYLNESDERRQRQRRAPFDPGLLRHPEIREAIVRGFGPTCAFCESDTRSFDFIEIEHHRPRFGAADIKGQTDPIYYAWLAYDWDNLYPICRICNMAKRNQFFVVGPRGAVGAPVSELRLQEQSLLLDPCFHDASEHLSFSVSGLVMGKTEIGNTSIEVFGLNREALVAQRQKHVRQVLTLLSLQELANDVDHHCDHRFACGIGEPFGSEMT